MNTSDVTKAAAEAAPPVTYVAVRLFGMSLPDWVALATLGYVLLQVAHLIWRWWRQAQRNTRMGD